MFQKKTSWEFSTAEEFQKRFVPPVFIKPEVPDFIRQEIADAQDLMVHSFYNYSFINSAWLKAVVVFEKTLKLKRRELGLSVKMSLNDLIKWFFDKNYFEERELDQLLVLVKVRNDKVHEPIPDKFGLLLLISINKIFDLINDLYEDVDLRLQRRRIIDNAKKDIQEIVTDGLMLEFCDGIFFGYAGTVLFCNNKLCPSILHLNIARCIESDIVSPGTNRDVFSIYNWKFESSRLEGILISDDSKFVISKIEKSVHRQQFLDWRKRNALWSLYFDSIETIRYEEKLRQFYRISSKRT